MDDYEHEHEEVKVVSCCSAVCELRKNPTAVAAPPVTERLRVFTTVKTREGGRETNGGSKQDALSISAWPVS